jgi:hypothetical protein
LIATRIAIPGVYYDLFNDVAYNRWKGREYCPIHSNLLLICRPAGARVKFFCAGQWWRGGGRRKEGGRKQEGRRKEGEDGAGTSVSDIPAALHLDSIVIPWT